MPELRIGEMKEGEVAELRQVQVFEVQEESPQDLKLAIMNCYLPCNSKVWLQVLKVWKKRLRVWKKCLGVWKKRLGVWK